MVRDFSSVCADYCLLSIPGWMLPEEMEFLWSTASALAPGAVVVEVGSWLGRSAAVLLAAGLTVVCVDPFSGEGTDKAQAVRECCYPFQVMARHAAHISSRGLPMPFYWPVATHDGWPVAWRPDLVFIDGDHEAAAVCRDVLCWRGRLSPDGILLGHDYTWPTVQEGLRRAGVAVEPVVGSIWRAAP